MEKFDPKKQRRLDFLMGKNTESQLTSAERAELVTLVRAAEKLTLDNARAARTDAERRKLGLRLKGPKAAA